MPSDEMDKLDNTFIFYIAGDNGASAEGTITGTLNEIKILNGVPEDPKGKLAKIDEIGGPQHQHLSLSRRLGLGRASSPLQWTPKQVALGFQAAPAMGQ